MEMKLVDGRYVYDGRGGLQTVSGAEELAQRLLIRLCAKRGRFLPMPQLGSRLYLLQKVRPSERDAAVKQYVAEAIAPEKGVTLESHVLRGTEAGVFQLELTFLCDDERLTLNLEV